MNNPTLTAGDVDQLVKKIRHAQTTATAIEKITNQYPELSIRDAYSVQLALKDDYLASGDRLVGWKAGLTSKPKMEQMGVNEPAIGFLTNRMAIPEGTKVKTSDMVHPRVECEIAFILNKIVSGNASYEEVRDAIEYVVPAIEIIDSRYENFKFDLPSVIADNSSSSKYVSGGRVRKLNELDLPTLGVILEKNGEVVAMGAGAEVLGDPVVAVQIIADILHDLGESLPAGSFVMSGGITAAIPVEPGDVVCARFQDLGALSIRFED